RAGRLGQEIQRRRRTEQFHAQSSEAAANAQAECRAVEGRRAVEIVNIDVDQQLARHRAIIRDRYVRAEKTIATNATNVSAALAACAYCHCCRADSNVSGETVQNRVATLIG